MNAQSQYPSGAASLFASAARNESVATSSLSKEDAEYAMEVGQALAEMQKEKSRAEALERMKEKISDQKTSDLCVCLEFIGDNGPCPVHLCVCLEFIGDNGPCPVHGIVVQP